MAAVQDFISIFQPIARGTCKYVPSCNAPKIKTLFTLHTLQKIDFKIIMILYLKFMINFMNNSVLLVSLCCTVEIEAICSVLFQL